MAKWAIQWNGKQSYYDKRCAAFNKITDKNFGW